MLGLTELGTIHTAISLVALAAGAFALVRDKKIVWTNLPGKIYVITTALTCITSFGIYRHGGFGFGHVLSILTLLLLLVALLGANYANMFGKFTPYMVMVAYTATYLFHFVAGITETVTRVPVAAPWASGPADPKLKLVLAAVFVLFIVGVSLQVVKLRAALRLKERS
ncbi:MAG TPA: hypothetical protein VN698_07750 [Bacteroidia bacterium]|nr:hypothetical protein [Bacteroidia bacterium]